MIHPDLRGLPATVEGWKVRDAKAAGWRMPWYWFPLSGTTVIRGKRYMADTVCTPRSIDWWRQRVELLRHWLRLYAQGAFRRPSPRAVWRQVVRETPPAGHSLEERCRWFRSRVWHAQHPRGV